MAKNKRGGENIEKNTTTSLLTSKPLTNKEALHSTLTNTLPWSHSAPIFSTSTAGIPIHTGTLPYTLPKTHSHNYTSQSATLTSTLPKLTPNHTPMVTLSTYISIESRHTCITLTLYTKVSQYKKVSGIKWQ